MILDIVFFVWMRTGSYPPDLNEYEKYYSFIKFRVLIWCLTLTGATLICVYGVEESDILIKELHQVMLLF